MQKHFQLTNNKTGKLNTRIKNYIQKAEVGRAMEHTNLTTKTENMAHVSAFLIKLFINNSYEFIKSMKFNNKKKNMYILFLKFYRNLIYSKIHNRR